MDDLGGKTLYFRKHPHKAGHIPDPKTNRTLHQNISLCCILAAWIHSPHHHHLVLSQWLFCSLCAWKRPIFGGSPPRSGPLRALQGECDVRGRRQTAIGNSQVNLTLKTLRRREFPVQPVDIGSFRGFCWSNLAHSK